MKMIVFVLVAGAALAGMIAGSAPASGQAHGQAADAIRPFHIKVSDEALTDLRRRLQMTRWPDQETVADPSQGVQLAKLQELVRPLCRPRGRLGSPGDQRDGAPGRGGIARHPPQPAGDGTARGGRGARPRSLPAGGDL